MDEKAMKSLISGLSDSELAELQQLTGTAAEMRRRKATLDTIRPGMSKDEEASALDEIRRVLGGLGHPGV